MTVKEIINIKLIDTEKFNLTVFDLITIFIIIFATLITLKIIKKVFKRRVSRDKMDKGSAYSIFMIIKYVIWIFVAGLILESLGFKLTLLIAGSAALLVGLGLGVQEIFNDIVSGILMLFERNLKVNDIVQIEDETIGKVLQIGIRTSKIETRDNVIIIVPNSKFTNDFVINWSHIQSRTRFNIDIDVAYGTDPYKVKEILLDCAKEHKEVAPNPNPFVRFSAFAESSLHFQLFFWTDKSFEVENIKSDIRFSVNRAFKDNNVTIPFPQRDVHIKPQ